MARHDRYSLPLSTTSDLAAERYRAGIDLLLSLWPGAAQTLDEAIAADPDFALAHAARARLHAIRAEVTDARAKIATALELVERNGTERERSHVAVLSHAINGRSAKALADALAHADTWPRDIVILSLPLGAFGLFAFSGMADHDQARVDLCERHARHFDADDWWFLTYRGWAHGENGDVRLGRALTERALELRRHNVNAAHAVAHVLYESGANDDARAMIAGWLPEYDRSGVLHSHIAWHAALIALERGDTDGALAIYDAHVAPSASLGVPINVVSDTASFLWRMQAYGHTVPEGMWDDAARYASGYFTQAGFAFADVHMALIAAATGDHAALAQRVDELTTLVDTAKLPAGPVVPAICRAALAFAEDDPARCAEILEPVVREVVRIGGSGAQREIVQDTLLVAWMRSGNVEKARALLDERLHRRPSPRDSHWLGQLASA
ncbi:MULTISPECIES: tetratricopeptide repeat protein [unclassified Burkholderia]|uniref:tetratricopeptide repeat protein n=1 Tax=unclassified Burkholderia TaxID=2613784 RepID=UPI000F573392|nr:MULTISPECIES: tetratricopeptide repeat protein [unclassified Burkholderia]RQR68693.1 tetratricopeptide repeat protein [Burkholderia sp. Bp9012]RQR70625.1 tetratricopeptide repeat protein [Burkholderia sp. Bp9011]RQR83622.1 tetratricopeptide repeat protein [Burkholderia sp. Bp9010]RQZ38985.1 tetratricopeptide repeat protein [Burkholderia sp. Bp9099]